MSPFIDAFLIGDGEEAIREILDAFHEWKTGGDNNKESLLKALSLIEGIYVPLIQQFKDHPSYLVKRRYIKSLDDAPYPDKPIVPYTSIIHDRVNIEVSRGCTIGYGSARPG